MSEHAPGPPPAVSAKRRDFSAAQLTMIRRTIARSCSDPEFDEFIAVAQQAGLDPLRRQIAPLIVHSDDPERRRLIPWATIDGLRVIAARQGDYRPMETAPEIERDDVRVEADRNPLGIVRAEVRAWKQSDGRWYPVAGEAWWDEYAPLREEWAPDARGQRKPTGKLLLDPSWARMGRVMIAKCAEAQALRRGWPDVLSGLYGEEELHALRFEEETASERLRQRDAKGPTPAQGQAAWFVFDVDEGLVSSPRNEIAARVEAFLNAAPSVEAIAAFNERNRLSLGHFWDWEPTEAMRLKQLGEDRAAALARATSPRARGRRAKRRADPDKSGLGVQRRGGGA